MKKTMILVFFMMLLFALCACTLKIGTKSTSESQQTSASTTTDQSKDKSTTKPADTSQSQPSTTSQSTEISQPGKADVNISNDLLKKNMEALISYRRKIKTSTTCEGQKSEKYVELAYIKEPFSSYMLQDFITAGAYDEEIIIDGIMWSRMGKNEKWGKYMPGEWATDPPRTFKYDMRTLMYPINYEKLTYTDEGTEEVNGVNCIKYTVSGTYNDEFTFDLSPQIYPITLTASGTIWISDDKDIKQVIICQRLKLNTDIVDTVMKDSNGNPTHTIFEDTLEDDVLDINSAKIEAPTE